MSKLYSVDQWLEGLASKGKNPSRLVEMTTAQMAEINPHEITFQSIEVDGFLIEAVNIQTNDLAMMAKHLLKPYEEGKLKHPLDAYLCALTSNNTYAWALLGKDVCSEDKFTLKARTFDIRTVVPWVDHYMIMHTTNNVGSLLDIYLQTRIDHVVAEIELKLGKEAADFVKNGLSSDIMISVYEHLEDNSLHECSITTHADGTTTSALFDLNRTEDAFFKQAHESNPYWVKVAV